MTLKSLWDRTPDEFLDLDAAADAVAETMVRFSAFVGNEQGACDTGTMRTMLEAAAQRYEEACE